MNLDNLIEEGLSKRSIGVIKSYIEGLSSYSNIDPKEAEEYIKDILISAGTYGGKAAQKIVIEGLWGTYFKGEYGLSRFDFAWKNYMKPLGNVAISCPELIAPVAYLYVIATEKLGMKGEVISNLGKLISEYASSPNLLREIITQLYSMLYSAEISKRKSNIMKAIEIYNDSTIQSLLRNSPLDLRGMIYGVVRQAINKGEDPKDRAIKVAEKYYKGLEELLNYWEDDR